MKKHTEGINPIPFISQHSTAYQDYRPVQPSQAVSDKELEESIVKDVKEQREISKLKATILL